MKIMGYVFIFASSCFLISCASYEPKGDGRYGYEDTELGNGLFHVVFVGNPSFGVTEKLKENWRTRANAVCDNEIKEKLLYMEHMRVLGTYMGITFVGGTPLFLPATDTVAVVEGVVLCNSSDLPKEEIEKILVAGYFIIE